MCIRDRPYKQNHPVPITSCGRRRTSMQGGKLSLDRSTDSPFEKQKGGGTRKTCLPASKIRSMSKKQRQKLVNAKQKSGKAGKYKRDPKSNVTGTKSKNLKDWVKQDWRQVGNPSKKCGEK